MTTKEFAEVLALITHALTSNVMGPDEVSSAALANEVVQHLADNGYEISKAMADQIGRGHDTELGPVIDGMPVREMSRRG